MDFLATASEDWETAHFGEAKFGFQVQGSFGIRIACDESPMRRAETGVMTLEEVDWLAWHRESF